MNSRAKKTKPSCYVECLLGCFYPACDRPICGCYRSNKDKNVLQCGRTDRIKAFLQKFYLRAAVSLNIRNTRDTWNHESSHDIFVASMCWNRFHFSYKFIAFDAKSTGNDWCKNYTFACMRELLETMSKQNARC